MATEKWVSRLEAKINALLEKAGIKPEDVETASVEARTTAAGRPQGPELTAAEQQAIDNAPATPAAAPPTEPLSRVDATTNAPVTPAVGQTPGQVAGTLRVPPEAEGEVTIETEQPSGETTVETRPADSPSVPRRR